LLTAIWPGVVVEENSLAQNISALRQALGDLRGENRYIVTLPRKGYQFGAEVRRADALPASSPSSRTEPEVEARPAAPPARGVPLRRVVPLVIAAVVLGAVVALLSWPRPEPASTRSIRLAMTLPPEQRLSGGDRSIVAISPNGQYVAYAATPAGLYVRALSDDVPRAVPGVSAEQTIGEISFSPDSQSIVFHTRSDGRLNRIAITGGSPIVICRTYFASGVSWQGKELFFVEPGSGILRVDAAGGEPRVVIKLEAGTTAQSPSLLPDQEHLLFSLARGDAPDRWDRGEVVIQSLRSGQRRTLLRGGADARYVPTGHLVYAFGGSLYAVPFDLKQLRVTSEPVAVISGVRRGVAEVTGTAQYAFSSQGTLVYVTGPASALSDIALSKPGESVARPLQLPPARYEAPRASPDGNRIAFGIQESGRASIWIQELSGGSRMKRLTQTGSNRFPVWSGDGRYVAFQSEQGGTRGIFVQPVDGTTATRLTTAAAGELHEPESWHGNTLLFSRATGKGFELHSVDVQGGAVRAFGGVRSTRRIGAVFSPDGRWVAYATENDAHLAVYVQPFPATGALLELTAGSNHPQWGADGKSLYFVPGPGRFQVVAFLVGSPPAFGAISDVPRPFGSAALGMHRPFDLLPDGRIVFPSPTAEGRGADVGDVQVVLNWFDELRRTVSGR
jgi:dipeptidyl aminopeptidase/acylaminoacyl peptidase